MEYFNYHTHTLYCDGCAAPEIYIKEAIKQGMTAIGFSSHSPLPFDNNYSIKENRIDEYKTEIRRLQEKYKNNIRIFLALEFDYIPGISDNFSTLKDQLKLDYTIGSVHLVKNKNKEDLWFIDGPENNYTNGLAHIFQNNIRLAVQRYFEQIKEMILSQRPTIIGHIDKVKMNNKGRYFSEEEEWYKNHAKNVLDAALYSGSIIEVNTRGIYKKRCDSLYPGINLLKEIYKMNIPVTISSDAHDPSELTSYFSETISILKDIGFKKIKYFSGTGWEDQKI